MAEPEIPIYYPPEWEEEYRRCGNIACWANDYPEMYDGSCGMHTPPYATQGTMENFANYALMYLLRQQECVHSITYYRLAAKRPSKAAQQLQARMREVMGNSFDDLRKAIQAT